ncbi:ankyrin repeat-containing protein At5g02620-like [Neltuma alba]|uniref:ankyrin repeat-containing protein At5g02620-like n=1 Tax=Neltuma alba TaxID=207710 RepID=UPI0010A39C6D|nr:ankyrin repeat-containing protein At5g02620-like [Prosopis alba]
MVGDVMALHRIMEEDPQVLEKASLALSADSPLHVAALSGRVDFVKRIMSLMPSLAMHTNREGLIPLHMASAQGHVQTVRELLKAKLEDEDDEVMKNQCLLKDNEGRTPLHYAVSRGRVGVVKELMRRSPECAEEVTAKGETALHLAVKANRLKVVQVMVESIRRLPNFQVILDKGKEEDKDEIKEETNITVEVEDGSDGCDEAPENKEKQKAASAEFQNTVLVEATLIITLSYQGLTNPPSTPFQTDTKIDWSCISLSYYSPNHVLFPSIKIIKTCLASLAALFLVINSIIFTQSIFLLLSSLRGAHGFLLILRLLDLFVTYNYVVLLEAFTLYAAYVTLQFTGFYYLPLLLTDQ